MGRHKALLPWDESTTFLEKLINEYLETGCNPVVCTVNEQVLSHCKNLGISSRARLLCNLYPERGRMYSVRLGLKALKESPYCFLQNVDNPFINRKVIRRIAGFADPSAWCSPEYKGQGGHPVLLPKKIIDKLLFIDDEDMTLRTLLAFFPKKKVIMEDETVCRNFNTPEEFAKLRQVTREERQHP
jgi:CTP:molybdopterin cytidylyltransferase MocA